MNKRRSKKDKLDYISLEFGDKTKIFSDEDVDLTKKEFWFSCPYIITPSGKNFVFDPHPKGFFTSPMQEITSKDAEECLRHYLKLNKNPGAHIFISKTTIAIYEKPFYSTSYKLGPAGLRNRVQVEGNLYILRTREK